MKLLIRAVQIIDTASPFHLQTKDILVADGKIVTIRQQIEAPADAEVFNGDGKCISMVCVQW